MLDLFEQSTAAASAPSPTEGRDLPATLGESFSSAWATNELSTSSIKQQNARNQAIREFSDQVSAAGGDVSGEYAKRLTVGPGEGLYEPDGLDVANTALAKLKASGKNPRLWLDPMTEDDIGKRSVAISQEAIASGAAMQGREQTFGSRVGGFLGGAASSAADPMNIPLMAVAPEESLGILGHAALFGAGAAASQVANEAVNARFNEMVQPGYGARGEAAGNVLEAGIGGAVLGGTLKAAADVLTRAFTGQWPTALRAAANVVKSEAQIQTTNVLPGVEGEAEHRAAIARSIDQIMNGHAVDPDIAAASQAIIERAQRETPFVLPRLDPDELARTSDEAGLRERQTALRQTLAELPPGDRQAAETLARVRAIEGQITDLMPAAERRALTERRDQLLADTTPEKLEAAAAPLEQRRIAEAEQTSIESRLKEIEDQRAKGTLAQIVDQQRQQLLATPVRYPAPTLFDIHEGRLDAIMGMRVGALGVAETSPELPHRFSGIVRGVTALAHLGAYDMPRDEAEALGERILAAGTSDEARFILGQVTDRPRTLLGTLPSIADFAADAKASAEAAPRPATIPIATMAETLASPETMNAMRADIERTIDEGAKAGKAPRIPIGVDADGEPIYGSVTRAMNEVDALNALADQIAACALPGAMQAEE